MPSGVMKRWNSEKGFGFIQPHDGGDDVFCHISCLLDGEGSVVEGDSCSFKLTYDDRKGKDRATDVVRGGGGGGGGRGRSRSRDRGSAGGGGGGYGGGGKSDTRPGDWECPGCGLNIFASKDSCFKCGATKSSGRRGGGGGRDKGGDRDRDYDRDRDGGRGRDRDYDRRR
eukprot:TRINITY_DN58_c0_g2_i2.p1 TRINITY_DN58_c0_g2~~TRINITY_DN58_c0_g2_i2.p1  ORF type:complete len:192 (-),score=34.30 TRINITY_DN58_c0_g2_i2:56-565(-)